MKYDHFVSQTGKISTVFSPILGDWERKMGNPLISRNQGQKGPKPGRPIPERPKMI